MEQLIIFLENKIQSCEELNMPLEKWAFIQCLKEAKSLQLTQPVVVGQSEQLFEAGILTGIEETEELTIEFADWLNNGRFSQYGNQWTNPKLPKNSNVDWLFFTSKQLYEIFKRERFETVA
jgi:hypothetical protein